MDKIQRNYECTWSNSNNFSSCEKLMNDNLNITNLKSFINISKWFTDPDFPYDKNEKITYNLKLENDFGEKIDLTSQDNIAKLDWIKWNEELTTIELFPTPFDIGIHYLYVLYIVMQDNEL